MTASDNTEGSGANFINLPPDKINKLRDAFQLIDQNNDGNISKEELKNTFASIGHVKNDTDIDEMFKEIKGADGQISFTNYLSLLSSQLSQVPNKNEITKAMKVFSEDMELNCKELKQNLLKSGLNEKEIDIVLNNFKTEKMNGDQVFMGNDFLNFIT